MKSKADKVLQEIKALVNLKFDQLQTFSSMYKTFAIGETAFVGGSEVVLLEKSKAHLKFRTIIPVGVDRGFQEHWHDCEEECIVIQGEMADLLHDDKSAGVGEKIIYSAMEAHMPYNCGDIPLVLEVNFYK